MTLKEKTRLFGQIQRLVKKEYFDAAFNGRDWPSLVSQHQAGILSAQSRREFETRVNALLAELGTSQTGLHTKESLIASRNSINATFRPHTGNNTVHWMFQDVLPGGPADNAGILPGDLLLRINEEEILPPQQPAFRMGSDSSLLLIHRNGAEQELKLTIHTKQPKYAERPYSEPQAILAKHLDSALGYLKVSLFPGMIGIDFARDVDKAIAELQNCDRLILDVRGNPGGGIGGLRLMSYLTSKKLPVGYSLSRQKASDGYNKEDLPRLNGIPNYKWQLPSLFFKFARRDRSIAVVTEGRPPQRWHGRLVVLTNEHTRGSAEMLAAFVRENGLGILVGQNTGGKLLAGHGFKLEDGYVLVLPVAAYLSWKGHRFEGNGVSPDFIEDWDPATVGQPFDNQMLRAIEIAKGL